MARKRKGHKQELHCSFCGKPSSQVTHMIAGPGANICNECAEDCRAMLDEEGIQKTTEAERKSA